MVYNKRDLKFSTEGDLEINNGDLELATPQETINQDILNRLKSNNPEWYRYPNIPANLEDIFGLDNTFQTAEIARKKIKKALTNDNRINEGDLRIQIVPTSSSTQEVFIFVNTGIEEELIAKHSIRLEVQ